MFDRPHVVIRLDETENNGYERFVQKSACGYAVTTEKVRKKRFVQKSACGYAVYGMR